MFETILVPTDGSDHAKKAVLLASDIAAKYKSRLVLLNVLPKGPVPEEVRRMAQVENITSQESAGAPLSPEAAFPASTVFGTPADSEDQTSKVLQFLADNILTDAKRTAQGAGVEEIASVAEEGDAAEQILKQAEKQGANLIVMGSRGLSDLKGLLMGSVSHKVSQLSACTCVTVK